MIYTDGIHLVTDGKLSELHAFAQSIGLKRCWFENIRGKQHPHYDIWGVFLVKAVAAGAICKRKRELAVILQESESVKSTKPEKTEKNNLLF